MSEELGAPFLASTRGTSLASGGDRTLLEEGRVPQRAVVGRMEPPLGIFTRVTFNRRIGMSVYYVAEVCALLAVAFPAHVRTLQGSFPHPSMRDAARPAFWMRTKTTHRRHGHDSGNAKI